MSEIEISRLIASSDFVPFDLSNNRATLGEDAGSLTWNAACEVARATVPPLLATAAELDAFRDFVRSFGAWSGGEISAWSGEECNALLLQFIAGEIREAFGDAEPSSWDWLDYEADAECGRLPGRLYRANDGRVYYSIAN